MAELRICLFISSLDGGGAERAFVELANHLAALGQAVHLVVAIGRGPYLSELSPQVRLVDLRSNGRWMTLWRLCRHLQNCRPDVLLSGLDIPNAGAVLAGATAGMGRRVFISQRAVLTPDWRLNRPRAFRIWKPILAFCYRRARHIICNSQAAADDLVGAFGIPPDKCSVIYNSLDIGRIKQLAQEAVDHSWGSERKIPLICSVGSLTVRKDVPTLLRAFAIVRSARPCRLVVLGEGNERCRLQKLAGELGIAQDVLMPGFDANPFRWMSRAKLFVSSSLVEGCPNVLLQALCCGVPIVATDCPGGTAEVLEDGRWGRLVKPGDHVGLASAMLESLASDQHPDGRLRSIDFNGHASALAYLDTMRRLAPPQERHTSSFSGPGQAASTNKSGG